MDPKKTKEDIKSYDTGGDNENKKAQPHEADDHSVCDEGIGIAGADRYDIFDDMRLPLSF